MRMMKKAVFLLAISLSLILPANRLNAQVVKSNVVKTNLFSPIIRTGHLLYERVINENMSGQLGFFYTGYTLGDLKLSGFGITPEYRYYLSQKAAPAGIYVAVSPRYLSLSLKEEGTDSEATWSAFGAALNVGAQALLKDLITIEAYLGPAYSTGSLNVKSGTENDFALKSLDGFGIRIGVTVGIAF